MGISSHTACPSEAATAKINRLNRIAGQVRGVAQMIEDDRYCIDILHQIAAIKSALAKVESQVLKDHAACCVADAITSGDEAEQRAKFEELVDLLERTRK
jgi:DNA-binding FrmR family transcriptional regulator